jgi:hypothetical protein
MPKNSEFAPTRLDSLPASTAQGRDISKDVTKAAKSRTATSLKGSAKGRTRC